MADDLAFDETVWADVCKGLVRNTIRNGHRDYQPDEKVVLFCTQYPELKEEVEIFSVNHCLAHEIDAGDINENGFMDHEDMYEGMKQFYPDFGPDSEVTVILW